MMVLFRLFPLRTWLWLALAVALAVGAVSVWRGYAAGKAAEARVEQLERQIRARDALDAVLQESREEAVETQEAVRALPRRELTVDEEGIARRIFP